MKILRLETEVTRRGVYFHASHHQIISEYFGEEIDGRHPTAFTDSKLARALSKRGEDAISASCNPEFRFGFANLAQLRAWFYNDEGLIELGASGINLAIYEISKALVMRGNAQVIFPATLHHSPVYEINLKSFVESGFKLPRRKKMV